MELNLQRQSIAINEAVFQGSAEHPIECDALLPDYCPDIVKVLKCNVETSVDSSSVAGDRLTIEGISAVHIYYTSEQNQIRHVEYKIPFGKSMELPSVPADPVITVVPSVDYVNCRAVNQRRVDVRGAISFQIKVMDRREEQVISDAQGGGLQLHRDMVYATDILGQTRSHFPVTDELDLGYGKQQVGNIIRNDCKIHVQDYKVVSGKVVVKGDFTLHILYQPVEDPSALEVMEYSLPISQIIECDKADDNCICDIQMSPVSCEVLPKTNDDGEYRSLGLDARVGANITVYRHNEFPVAGDCYSTRYESKCQQQPVSFSRLVKMVGETVVQKVTLDLPEGIQEVLDAWCTVDSLTWKQEASTLALAIKLTICLFARMENGECLYFEQTGDLDHSITLEADCTEAQFDPVCHVISSAFSLVGREKIDMRCEVSVRGCVTCTVKKNAISAITLDEARAKAKEYNRLYIYYADAGESVWNIAKRYNTPANAIWDENNLDSDILQGKSMLLIPII